jgi:hypothetical protein
MDHARERPVQIFLTRYPGVARKRYRDQCQQQEENEQNP